jgi:glycosyltransferase involved in cell wall biosynthesis
MGLGGAQSALLDLLEARHQDLAPTVLALRDRHRPAVGLRLERAGVPFERARLALGRPQALVQLRRFLRNSRPDVVHAHLEWSCHLAGALVLSLGRDRPRLVLQTDNDPRRYAALHRGLARRIGPLADAHVVPGRSIAGAMRELVGRPLPGLAVIPLGIRPENFQAERADPHEVARLRAGAPAVIGAVGRLAPQKNLSVLLQALPRLLPEVPNLRVLLVGSGPLRGALEREAADLGVAGAVRFSGVRTDLATVYAALDVLAFPSAHEGQGLVLLEAMAARVPVVASAVSGVADVVTHGRNGLLVPVNEPEALAAAILRVLRDAPLRHVLAEGGLEQLRDRFNVRNMVEATERLYRRLLARTRPPPWAIPDPSWPRAGTKLLASEVSADGDHLDRVASEGPR